MSERPEQSSEPTDRLTELCAVMTDRLDEELQPGEEVKCAVFLQDGNRGGLQLHGYEDSTEAIVDVFMHLRALFRANGKDLLFAPMPGQG